MKIYTKKGDTGKTTLAGGNKTSKDSIIVDAYGTIDELISHIGIISSFNIDFYYKELCVDIQNKLMLCAAQVATTENNDSLPNITYHDVEYLEKQIDKMEEELEPLSNFVLFVGVIASNINIFRTLTRRAERLVVRILNKKMTDNQNINLVIKYLNRLSDLFFVMARHVVKKELTDSKEIIWKI